MKPHLPDDKELLAAAEAVLSQLNEFADIGDAVFRYNPANNVLGKACELLYGMGTWYQRREQLVQACRYYHQTEALAYRVGSGWGIAAHEGLRDLRREHTIPESDYLAGAAASASVEAVRRLISEFIDEWKPD